MLVKTKSVHVSKGYGILSVDPGIRGTGICVWSSATWRTLSNPVHLENFMPKQYDDWVTTSEKYYEKFNEILNKYFVRRVFCEFPQYFSSSLGHSATAKGDIHKLAFLVGVFAGATWEFGGEFNPILVNDWKGQLSKPAVIQRIVRRLPTIEEELQPSTHSWDAVGIGLFAQGEDFGR